MEISGTIRVIGDEIQVSEKYRNREVVVETDGQWAQKLPIEFAQDRIDLPDPYNVGDRVKVSINLAGSEWVNPQGETKYFLKAKGWKIEKLT